ncbi:Alpha/beta hydrolase family protein [Rubripirellula lacrimiformis]|uniref:Alpha/beta hydrolase family protein n=1 Tax=Rubripirellula lacrimiformis TaxID=1930273 RepID=A0A517N6X6_9BACT|nr:prolyl oligopeptidase family serine peptidase [Rubripirellula lacrimiformis]QDT02899.1 Alpha/beta hydrolase family protein [Rubripirellula lacrimiformis]
MNRFEKSMSWDLSADQGRDHQPSDSGPGADSDHPGQSGDAGHFQSNWDSSGHHHLAPLGDSAWGQVRSKRSYFLPVHYTPGYQYPLIVWLHSDGFNENQVTQVMPHISLRNYVAVGVRGNRAADSIGHRFDWHDSPAGIGNAHDAVVDAADEASDRYSTNPTRIILAGYGAGGSMALRIAMRDPRRFAAAVSVGGRMPQGAIRNPNQLRRRRMPMLWQWSSDNPDYTADGLKTDCQSAMAVGARVEIRQYPGEDEMDTVVLSDLDRWIMRQVVSGTGQDDDRWESTATAYSAN